MSNNIQNKLYGFEAVPPATVWNDIAASLDAQQTAAAEKLYNYQQQPPENVWKSIEKGLSQTATPKAKVHYLKKYNKPIGWLSAAAVLVAAVIFITVLTTRTSDSDVVPHPFANEQPVAGRETTDTNGITTIDVPGIDDEGEVASTPTTTERTGITSTDRPAVARTDAPRTQSVSPQTNRRTESNEVTRNTIASNKNYITVTNEAGQKVRVTRKVYDIYACANRAFNSNVPCKEQVESLQQRAASTIGPSGFGGFLDLLSNLQD